MSKLFRVKYEYTSPFGEEWIVQKKHLGFLWFRYGKCDANYQKWDENSADNMAEKLNGDTLTEQRLKKIKKLLES